MERTTIFHELTDEKALAMINAGVAMARQIDVPECIVIVDVRGRIIASQCMTGAKFTSLETATAKAVTAASNRTASGGIPAQFENLLAPATNRQVTNLQGGLPVVIDGNLCGAIGVGSGSPEQDLKVANAALSAVNASAELWRGNPGPRSWVQKPCVRKWFLAGAFRSTSFRTWNGRF